MLHDFMNDLYFVFCFMHHLRQFQKFRHVIAYVNKAEKNGQNSEI